MNFFGRDTYLKLIWTSGEDIINRNTISKQGISKIYFNKIYTSSTLGFGFSLHKDTCDILFKYFVS